MEIGTKIDELKSLEDKEPIKIKKTLEQVNLKQNNSNQLKGDIIKDIDN